MKTKTKPKPSKDTDQSSLTTRNHAEVSALPVEGFIDAPVVFFDEAPALGVGIGVGRILLTALVHSIGQDGQVILARKAVAQLRGTASGLQQLRAVLDQIEQISGSGDGAKH